MGRPRSDPDLGPLTTPFSPILLLSACASPRPWLTQLQMNRQGEPGSTPGPLHHPLGGTNTAALHQDSLEATAAPAISREHPALAPAGSVTWAVGFRMPWQPGLGCWAPQCRATGCCSSHQCRTERRGHGWAGGRPWLLATANPLPQHWEPLCSVQNISQPLDNGISMPGKTPRTLGTHQAQENVGHGQAKPYIPTLG